MVLKQVSRHLRHISGRRQPSAKAPDARRVVKLKRRATSDRRGEPRFDLDLQADLYLTCPGDELRYPVRDLSASGLSVVVDQVASWALGQARPVRLHLGPLQVPLQVVPVNHHRTSVGLRIVSAPSLWTNEIGRLLDPRRIGQQLREVASPRDGGPRLFRSPPACELCCWYRGASVERAQLVYLWQVVDWTRSHGLRTATLEQAPDGPGAARRPLELLRFDAPANEELLHTARAILHAAPVPRDLARLFGG